jgi:hypothetical protein
LSKLKGANPFYVMLAIVGVVFVITACLYGVMTVRMLDPAGQPQQAGGAELIVFVDRHGATALAIELGVLAILTVLAISTDGFWTRRATSFNPEPAATALGTNNKTVAAGSGINNETQTR